MEKKDANILIVAGIVIAIIGCIVLMIVINEKSATASTVPKGAMAKTRDIIHTIYYGSPTPQIPLDSSLIGPIIIVGVGVVAIIIGLNNRRISSPGNRPIGQ